MSYLLMSCLISKYVGNFSRICYFEFSSVVAKWYTLYDFNPFTFIDTCFMGQNIVYLGESFMFTWIVYAFCCWVEYVWKYQLGQIDTVVQAFYLINFLLYILSLRKKFLPLRNPQSTIVDLSISLFSYCLMYFEPLLLDLY